LDLNVPEECFSFWYFNCTYGIGMYILFAFLKDTLTSSLGYMEPYIYKRYAVGVTNNQSVLLDTVTFTVEVPINSYRFLVVERLLGTFYVSVHALVKLRSKE
jgi:hypothetical protein